MAKQTGRKGEAWVITTTDNVYAINAEFELVANEAGLRKEWPSESSARAALRRARQLYVETLYPHRVQG